MSRSSRAAPTSDSDTAAGLRVMIVGDSMSQGREGDWTWRYRIWQWFRAEGVTVTFVGPYTGTVQPDVAKPPSPPPLYGSPGPIHGVKADGGYARGVSPDFDGRHFAAWGRTARIDKGLIENVLTSHPADVMLLMLGFNDMGWCESDAPGTLRSVKELVDNARRINPQLKFAIADVPQRETIGGREDLSRNTRKYNRLFRKAIPNWSTSDSPVHVVKVSKSYDCDNKDCPAAYDGLHPNALGEYQIARAFSLTLVKAFKLGFKSLKIPKKIPERPLPPLSNFEVASSPGGVTATWDAVYGAYSYDVRSRISGITEFQTSSVPFNRWDARWTQEGWTYDVQVRASAGNTQKGGWTTVKSAKSTPQTPPAPENVVVRPTATGFDISWDRFTGDTSITMYEVLYWDRDRKFAFVSNAGFKESPAHVDNLTPSHHYNIAIISWNFAGGGFPKGVNSVTIGRGTPPVPTDLKVVALDDTTAQLTWSGSSSAAGYHLWFRNVSSPEKGLHMIEGSETMPCSRQYFLAPGVWNYEWCVSAFNGNEESARCPCVLSPRPSSQAESSSRCSSPIEQQLSEKEVNISCRLDGDRDTSTLSSPDGKYHGYKVGCDWVVLFNEDNCIDDICDKPECSHNREAFLGSHYDTGADCDSHHSQGDESINAFCSEGTCLDGDCKDPECWIDIPDSTIYFS